MPHEYIAIPAGDILTLLLSLRQFEISRRNAGCADTPPWMMPRGLIEKNARARSYYSGFRTVRRRYGELCMVSPATSRRAAPGSFPCMPCICRVIDGCVNFIGARYRYEPGLSSSTRRLRYAGLASRCESERVIFLGAINLPPILIQGSESATVNGRTIERRYPTRIFFVGRVTHRRTRERVLPSSVTRPVS